MPKLKFRQKCSQIYGNFVKYASKNENKNRFLDSQPAVLQQTNYYLKLFRAFAKPSAA